MKTNSHTQNNTKTKVRLRYPSYTEKGDKPIYVDLGLLPLFQIIFRNVYFQNKDKHVMEQGGSA